MAEASEVEMLEPGAAAAALHEVNGWIDAIRMPNEKPPMINRAKAVSSMLDLDRLLHDQEIAQAFESLPATYFDHQMIVRLKPLALSIWAISNMVKNQEAVESRGKLPAELVDEANAMRNRLFQLVSYYLGDDPKVGSILSDIKGHNSYLDLAQDLARLGDLVTARKADLENDRRYYSEGCGEDAHKVAQKILQKLNGANFEKLNYEAKYDKIWAVACAYYGEIYIAGKWLFRHSPIVDRFVNLASSTRKSSAKKAKPTNENA